MLKKFSVSNYRGFESKIELDFSRFRDYEFNTFAIKNGIIKNGIIYGPNGCGKTNFGLAIFDIICHLTHLWRPVSYYNNFIFAGNQKSPVEFEYVFQFDDTTIVYRYSKNIEFAIQTEELIANNKTIFKLNPTSLDLSIDFPMDDVKKKAFLEPGNKVSVLSHLVTAYPMEKNHYLRKLQNFVESMLWFRCLDSNEYMGLDNRIYSLDEYIIQNGFVKDFSDFLLKISNQRFDFVPPQPNDKHLFCYIKGVPVHFGTIASTGTRALELLFFWLTKINTASFVFIDEFDAFYHYKLAHKVCEHLFSLDFQIFLSSHNTYLMTNDLLRPDCNFILNNNKIKPLNECTSKELRFGHNIEKLYRGDSFEI